MCSNGRCSCNGLPLADVVSGRQKDNTAHYGKRVFGGVIDLVCGTGGLAKREMGIFWYRLTARCGLLFFCLNV